MLWCVPSSWGQGRGWVEKNSREFFFRTPLPFRGYPPKKKLAPHVGIFFRQGLFPADKRPGWGGAVQPEQTGGLCALKHK